ncbi:MAG: polar amino acid transport system substrate-binding protein [Halobacteriales archaeon]|jgi:polar amino acid transport system substrate-binding protein
MSGDNTRFNRRTYLKLTGASGVAMMTAGCLGDLTGGGGDDMTIVAGTAPGFPPFEMKEGGELVGFDVDLLEAVVEETDYTLKSWNEYEFKTLIPSLANNKIDVIAAAMTITDERDEKIDFTDPYYSADQGILVRTGGDFQPSQLDDLSGHDVGAQQGTTGENVVKTQLIEKGKLKSSKYNSYGNYVLAVKDLQNGNIDALVLDTPVAKTFSAQRPVSIAFEITTGENYGFGVQTNDDDLTEALNSGLSAVRDSGKYEEITTKWFASE